MNLRLNGIQSCHVHLQQPVLPVDSRDPAVMDASRYVTKSFPILPEAVILVVHAEGWRCPKLQVNISHHDSQLPTTKVPPDHLKTAELLYFVVHGFIAKA